MQPLDYMGTDALNPHIIQEVTVVTLAETFWSISWHYPLNTSVNTLSDFKIPFL